MRALHRPSPALVVAVIALVFALGGTGWAVATLPAKSVGTKQLKDRAVVTAKLANKAVTASKLADGAAVTAKLADGAAVTAKLANGAVVTAKLSDNAVTGAKLANGAVTAAKVSGELPAAGVAGLNYASTPTTVPPNTAVAVTAICAPGTVPVGGGAELPHSIDQFILDSHPIPGQGWQAGVGNASAAPAAITVYAVCVRPAPSVKAMSARKGSVVRLGAFSR